MKRLLVLCMPNLRAVDGSNSKEVNLTMLNRRNFFVLAISLAAFLAGCGFNVGEKNSWDVTQPIETGVTVEATGFVKVVPDGVQFNFLVFAVESTSRAASQRVNVLADQARDALSNAGIDSLHSCPCSYLVLSGAL